MRLIQGWRQFNSEQKISMPSKVGVNYGFRSKVIMAQRCSSSDEIIALNPFLMRLKQTLEKVENASEVGFDFSAFGFT